MLVPFDPDAPETDIIDWCALSEIVIKSKMLEGVDLIFSPHSLSKGPRHLVSYKNQAR